MISISRAFAEPVIVVGKDFTEQGILAEITNQLLKNRGFSVEKIHGLTTSELHDHMRDKRGDVYWQYTTTRLMLTYGDTANYDKQTGYEKVKQLDLGAGYKWLNPTTVNNTYALAMRKQQAEELGISSISDLFSVLNNGTNLRVGVNDEFASRPDGLLPLERTYGGHIRRSMIAQIDTDYVYQALRIFGIDVGIVFATDGRIRGYNFVILNDDKDFFFNYILVPVVKKDTVDANPSLVEALNALSAKLNNATMIRLNAEADIGKRLIRDVAAEFLRNNDLLR